jgi:tetratricopeptide (TPR) repeat protein
MHPTALRLRRGVPSGLLRGLRRALPWVGCLLGVSTAPTVLAAPQPVGAGEVQGPGSASGTATASTASTADERLAAVQAALAAGELEAAHGLLTELLVDSWLAEARGDLVDGRPADALVAIDDALETARPSARRPIELLRAEALLALGEQGIASGQGGAFVSGAFEDALATYRAAGRSLAAQLGAARAAYLLNRSDEALAYAREASAKLPDSWGPQGPTLGPGGLPAERVLADAVYLAYADEVQRALDAVPEADAEREQALFAEALGAAEEWLAVAPEQLASWQRAVDLYLFRIAVHGAQEDRVRALAVVERGLERLPSAPLLLRSLPGLARQVGGGEAALAALEREQAHFDPLLALGGELTFDLPLALGEERFELALRDFPRAGRPAEEFRRTEELLAAAERDFAAVEEQASTLEALGLDPQSRTATARSWRIICRTARGWLHYFEGDLEASAAAFRSTEEWEPRGLEWRLGDRLASGLEGLEFLTARHLERGELAQAAELADLLHHRRPEDPDLANNAGFLARDAATAYEDLADSYCRAARGTLDDPGSLARLSAALPPEAASLDPVQRSELFRARAAELRGAALAWMERSGAAYGEARRLAPTDVRVINDAALVFVYYLHRELDRSEQWLLEAVQLGEAQLAAAEALDDERRYDLLNAFGDAHENLGVLFLEHRGDPERAESWFRRALEIGPDPRPVVLEYWLPRVAAARAQQPVEPSYVLDWARPCP